MQKDDFLVVHVNGRAVATQLTVEEGMAVTIALHARLMRDETSGDPEAALDRIVETVRIENSGLWEDEADDPSDDESEDSDSDDLDDLPDAEDDSDDN